MSSSALQIAFLCVFLSLSEQQLILKPDQDKHTKALGDAIVFTCSLPDGEVKWFDTRGNEITERAGRLYIEDDDSQMSKLYITNITRDDAGKYSCQGKIGDIEDKRDVELLLFEDITFGDFPLVQNPKLNEDALILCTVRGNPEPTVSWRHNGRRLTEGSQYSVANSSGLIIRNITEADDGVYVCRGEVEADGRLKEALITVKVHVPPKITRYLESSTVVQDAPVSLHCKASGLPQPSFEFFKDDSDVPLVSSDAMNINSEDGSLSFTSVKKSDDGNYTCKAVNRVGSDSTIGQLKVLVKPFISRFVDVVGVKENEVSIVCIADGDPVPSLKIYSEGSSEAYEEGISDDEHYTVSSSQGQLQLTLHKLRLEDSGKYSCNASSTIGSDEKTASIMVQFEPSFVSSAEVVYNWAGNVQNLTCEPSGEPTPDIVWVYSNTVLENNDTFRIYNLEGRSVLEVRVREVDQSWIYGTYTCQATNSLGKTAKKIEMLRAMIPDSPVDVMVVERLPTAIALEVTPPLNDGGVPVTGYVVEYSAVIQKTPTDVDETMSSDSNETDVPETTFTTVISTHMNVEFLATEKLIRIENLKADTTYHFSVRARNDIGLGNPFKLTNSTVAFSEPRPIVINSTNTSTDPYKYTVTWKQPNTGGQPIKRYEFQYRKVAFNKSAQAVNEIPGSEWTFVTASDDKHQLKYTIEKLSPNSYYQLKIRAENEVGWSELGKEFLFSTVEVDDSAASSQQAGAATGVVIGIVVAVFIIFLIIVDISCYFINACGVTNFLCARICKKTPKSKAKSAEEGESDIIKQPLPDDENVASVQETGVEKSVVKEEQETRLNQVPEEKDEDLKEPLKDEKIQLEDPKVVDGEEMPLAKKAETTEAV